MSVVVETVPWIADARPLDGLPASRDPLGFPGYAEQLADAEARTGRSDSVDVLVASVGGHRVVIVAFEFGFMGGSMGEATGERIVRAIDAARERRLPLLTVAASGGARMQEGMRSLIQMQRVAAALRRLRAAGVPHLAVAGAPTTGGVWASLVADADVIVATEGATVAFTGARVRGGADDEEEFTADAKFASGAVDAVVDEHRLGATVERYVHALAASLETSPSPCPVPYAASPDSVATGWEAVQVARRPDRPSAEAHLEGYFDDMVALSGDRAGGRDPGLRCGIGLRSGCAVAFIAQTGVANSAAGFRTAARVLRLASRWQIPVLSLIDTPGAQHDAAAEHAGIGTAIAQAFSAVAELEVPMTSLLVGEGGSGGALALAAPDALWVMPGTYFSVIAPELAAAILHRRDISAADIAEQLMLAPSDLVRLGVARGIVGPAPSGAEERANALRQADA